MTAPEGVVQADNMICNPVEDGTVGRSCLMEDMMEGQLDIAYGRGLHEEAVHADTVCQPVLY